MIGILILYSSCFYFEGAKLQINGQGGAVLTVNFDLIYKKCSLSPIIFDVTFLKVTTPSDLSRHTTHFSYTQDGLFRVCGVRDMLNIVLPTAKR